MMPDSHVSAQPVEPFSLVAGGCLGLGLAQRVELVRVKRSA